MAPLFRARAIVIAGIALAILAGCEANLRTLPAAKDSNCFGVGLNGLLAGSPTDPRIAWYVSRSGTEQNLVWPPGYRARFAPKLEILDPQGKVVMHEGDPIAGGCVVGPSPGGLLISPLAAPRGGPSG